MTEFTERLNNRRKELGLSVQDVVAALQLQGVDLTYQAVAAWFNGGRGERWSPEVLHIVLELLQTDLPTTVGNKPTAAPDFSSPIYNAVARELASLSPQQQAALLSLIKSFRA